MSEEQNPPPVVKPPTFLQVVGSVFAAMVGLQSSKNRERDFSRGNLKVYIVGGMIFTILFILTLLSIIRIILS